MTQPHISAYAPYACLTTRGRLIREADTNSAFPRNPFQRDRDRIIHSAAFRRLKHKTQVFLYHEGDYFRTRLTHSLEVAQIARSVARALRVNEDIAEAVALGHDLGHPPFGHAGEDALNRVMVDFGGFDHNEQTVRVLTELEERYADFNGLNLCYETLEGIIKHNGPIEESEARPTLIKLSKSNGLNLSSQAVIEAQIANISDDIAYMSHDFDDALRAGLITTDQLTELPVVGAILHQLQADYGELAMGRLTHELTRRIISHFVSDLLHSSSSRLAELDIRSVEDVCSQQQMVIQHSEDRADELATLKQFLFVHSWRHYKVNRMTSKAKSALTQLFTRFYEEPELLPDDWQRRLEGRVDMEKARIIADYVASMTDRYALLEYDRIFELGPILV